MWPQDCDNIHREFPHKSAKNVFLQGFLQCIYPGGVLGVGWCLYLSWNWVQCTNVSLNIGISSYLPMFFLYRESEKYYRLAILRYINKFIYEFIIYIHNTHNTCTCIVLSVLWMYLNNWSWSYFLKIFNTGLSNQFVCISYN